MSAVELDFHRFVVPAGPRARRGLRGILLVTAALLLAGCAAQRPLMPPPCCTRPATKLYASTMPDRLREKRVAIIYATDRVPEPRADGRLDYGIGRSYSLAVGQATVDIGGDATWEELVEDAASGIRSRTLYLDIPSVTETARTPEHPYPYTVVDGLPVVDAEVQRRVEAVAEGVERKLRERLTVSPRKEILLYVHGVSNTFDEALFTTAELWHYMGRDFVPVAYSWPAGKGGLLRGYTYDRESSEFTVFHFKRFLQWLSRLPEVEGIQVIAHSRGTDVVTTAIRELLIEARARGERPRASLKLRNLVLAAPDINVEIAIMRTATEYLAVAVERLTVYTSPHDQAMGISEFLFSGGLRLGQVDYRYSREKMKERMKHVLGNQSFVEYMGTHGGAYGHNYFRTNPAVSSDLVLAVRYGRDPGAGNGRPLHHQAGIFWTIDDDYLAEAPPH